MRLRRMLLRLLRKFMRAQMISLAMSNGRRLDGEPLKLIERALQIDPTEIKALALAGTAAYDHQEYAKAVGYWERAIKAAPNDPEFARSLKASLDEARGARRSILGNLNTHAIATTKLFDAINAALVSSWQAGVGAEKAEQDMAEQDMDDPQN